MRKAGVVVGTILVILASYLAIWHGFIHFYEIMIAGLVIAQSPFVPRHTFDRKALARLYALTVFFGFIVDYIIGISLSHAWHYSYTSPIEYAILYFYTYPLGGLAVLQSYLILSDYFGIEGRVRVLPMRRFWRIALYEVVGFALVYALRGIMDHAQWLFLMCIFYAAMAGVPVILMSEYWHQRSYPRDLMTAPLGTIAVTLIATGVGMFFHELPNVYAHEWVYTPSAGTFLDSPLIGIPLVVWVFWPALIIGMVSMYYLVKARS